MIRQALTPQNIEVLRMFVQVYALKYRAFITESNHGLLRAL